MWVVERNEVVQSRKDVNILDMLEENINSSFRIKKTVEDIRGWRILINLKGPIIFIGPEWGYLIFRGVV